MSFQRLGSFLPRAFERIDKKNTLRQKTHTKNIQSILQTIIPDTPVEYYNGILVFFTVSQVAKQKIQILENTIKNELKKHLPGVSVSGIRFKAPQ